MMEISLLENIHRENLSAIEETKAYKNLIDKRGIYPGRIRETCQQVQGTCSKYIETFIITDKVQKLVENGTLSAGQARPLITVNPKDIDKLVDKVVKENLSARRVEMLVQDYKNPVIKNTPVISEAAYEYQKRLQHYLQTRVKIDGTKITVNYINDEDLERIMNCIIGEEK